MMLKKDNKMSASDLHPESVIIDGLMTAKWNREPFEATHRGRPGRRQA